MSMVGFPLLLIPLAIYNIIAFLMRGVSFAAPLLTLPLPSGLAWAVTLSDVLLTLGILLLLCEVIKGARPGAKYLMDHLLSLLVVGGAGAEFALAAIRYLDLFPAERAGAGGFPVRYRVARTARNAASIKCRGLPAKCETRLRMAAPEPQFGPEPAPPVPAATTVAESVLLDHAEPKIVHPDVASNTPSPEVPSPGPQPGNGPASSPDTPSR